LIDADVADIEKNIEKAIAAEFEEHRKDLQRYEEKFTEIIRDSRLVSNKEREGLE